MDMKNRFVRNSIALLVAIIVICSAVFVLDYVGRKSSDSFLKSTKDAIARAAVSCYAIEGIYPADISYLKDHYGLMINESKYAVYYIAYASNIMPDIDVVPKK